LDINLTFIGERIDLPLLAKFENEMDDLNQPYTLDISVTKEIANPELTEHIERVGKSFYKRVGTGETCIKP